MATVNVTSTPVVLDAAGAVLLGVANTGSVDVFVNTQRLRPGQSRVFDTVGGLSVSTITGTGTVDTTTVAAAASAPAAAASAPRPVPRQRPTIVTTMAAGHGFGIYGNDAAATNLNDTSDFVLGSQSVKVVTAGAGAFCFCSGAIPATNLTGRTPVVWFKLDDASSLQSTTIHIYLASGGSSTNRYDWQVLGPYVQNQALSNGNWLAISLPFADATVQGTPDRTAVNFMGVAVTDPNTGTKVTYRFNGLGHIAEPAAVYPNGCVVLALDDSMDGQASIAQPILSAAGFQATLFPICDRMDTAGRLTTAQARTMQDVLGWEVGTHAYTQATHDAGWHTLQANGSLAGELGKVRGWLAANGFTGGDTGALPLGSFSTAALATAGQYVSCVRTSQPFPRESLPIADPYRIRGVTNVGGAGGTSVAALTTATTGQLDKTVADRGLLVLTFHQFIATGTPVLNQTLRADFQTLVTAIQTRGMAVRTLGDALALR